MYQKIKGFSKTGIDYDRTTHAIIMNKSLAIKILENTKHIEKNVPIDELYNNLFSYIPEITIYEVFPHLCYSPKNYKSDIILH